MSIPPIPTLEPEQPEQPAPKKKTSPLVWILGGVAVLLFGGMLTYLMRSNPGLAMAKMAAALHPDMEVVSTDDRSGTIVMREKSTGKTMSFRFDPAQKTLVMTGQNGEEVKISSTGDGKSSTVEVQSAQGTSRFNTGAGNASPAWFPVYPGSTPENTSSVQTPDGDQNVFTFKTNDAPDKVISYYQSQLKSAGFNVTLASSGEQGGIFQAEDGSRKRTVIVNVDTPPGEGTRARVVTAEKK